MNHLFNIHNNLANWKPEVFLAKVKKKIHTHRKLLLGLCIGLFLGWISTGSEPTQSPVERELSTVVQTWTCSMHPHVNLPQPDACPLCGMALIQAERGRLMDEKTFSMHASAVKLANIQVSSIELAKVEKTILLQGKVKVDERRQALISAPYAGEIEQLWVDYTGISVKARQPLATIFSSELIAAQEAYFDASSIRESHPAQFIAIRNQLRRWQITEEHIEDLEIGKNVQKIWNLSSPISGIVSKKLVFEGQYVKEGTPLLEVVDLKRVWVVFEAYETDIQWLKQGDLLHFKVAAFPEQAFSGKISYIAPWVDPQSRTVSVRLEIANPGLRLKPDMFVEGWLSANKGDALAISVPKSAVLWTGKQSLVYVKLPHTEDSRFELREIVLGTDLGGSYTVEKGLEPGEMIVTHGTFKVDAAAQLAGKTSMMNVQQKDQVGQALSVSPAFQASLTQLFHTYTQLKNALVKGNPDAAQQFSQQLQQQLDSLKTDALTPQAIVLWQKDSRALTKVISALASQKDLASQRQNLEALSKALLSSIRHFGINTPVYKAYCPMAFDNKGAFWLSEMEEIRNPYFGEAMLNCGMVKEVIGD